jgi:hypothetical protein
MKRHLFGAFLLLGYEMDEASVIRWTGNGRVFPASMLFTSFEHLDTRVTKWLDLGARGTVNEGSAA